MNEPITFQTAWSEAEQAAFSYLVSITNAMAGKSAFLGRNPGVVNAWHLENQPIEEAAGSVLLARDQPSLAIQYTLSGTYLKREKCQDLVMSLLGGLPVRHIKDTNIACLRVRSVGKVDYGEITIANESKATGVWSVEVLLDLVFATGGKPNVAELTEV